MPLLLLMLCWAVPGCSGAHPQVRGYLERPGIIRAQSLGLDEPTGPTAPPISAPRLTQPITPLGSSATLAPGGRAVVPPTARLAAADPNSTALTRGLSSISRNRAINREEDENPADYPGLHDDPLAFYGYTKDQHDRFVFPWLMNLLTEDLWLLEKDPAKARKRRIDRRSRIDIRDPDPDTANFPNGAYTLPKGRLYIETSPVGLYGPSKLASRQYQWESLFRYGVTDNLEFRVFSNGLTVLKGKHPTTGVAPLAFDFKFNFWEENRKYFIPAVGLEVFIQTTFGSPALNGGTQPSLNLLLDQTLPFEINFEHNFSMTGLQIPSGTSVYEFGYSWSFQRQLFKDFDIFTHGFYNSSSLPRFRFLKDSRTPPSMSQSQDFRGHPDLVVAGMGAIWTLNNRMAIFGSYNFGLNKFSPSTIALFGLAFAF